MKIVKLIQIRNEKLKVRETESMKFNEQESKQAEQKSLKQ